jgi:hypothetical protein
MRGSCEFDRSLLKLFVKSSFSRDVQRRNFPDISPDSGGAGADRRWVMITCGAVFFRFMRPHPAFAGFPDRFGPQSAEYIAHPISVQETDNTRVE